jgi:murein DD-endopeptidase MepM/ murein hydrolase activator NlpD
MRFWLILLVTLFLILGGGAYWFSEVDLVEDHQKPTVTLINPPKGMGVQAREFQIKLSDQGAGLDRVTVNLKQRGYSKELYRKALAGIKETEFSLSVAADQSYLVEGEATIEIKVLDRSLVGNPIIETLPIQIDFKAPKLKIVTSQHNLQLGGSQLAFYELKERALFESGIQVGNLRFIGYPARKFDLSLDAPELFAVLYTVPAGSTDKPVLFAEDLAGNIVTANFYNLVLNRKFGALKVSSNREAFNKTLSPESLNLSATTQIEDYVRADRNKAALIIAESSGKFSSERLWKGNFTKPLGSVRTAFGAQLKFYNKSETILSYVESGYVFSGPLSDSNVSAPNTGKIVFSGELPFYGKSIVIDHGFGLSTMLGNLGALTSQVGERVLAGQIVGERSPTGILGNGTIFIEMRLQGVPVEPREWWDAEWVKQHIDNKIKEVKGNYGL